jgi:hypothetical protein
MKKDNSTKKAEKFDYKTIKSFEDACKALGIEPNLPEGKGLLEEFVKPLTAAYKLMIIYRAINNGWKPNWGNSNEYKYYPWFGVLSSGFGFDGSDYDCTYAATFVGSRLCTDSSEKALYIAKQFEQEYKNYFLYQ